MKNAPLTLPCRYATINETCDLFGFSRSTFYRMLEDPDLGLKQVVVRIPPVTGRIRVPVDAFEALLRRKSRGRS
tara:strand:- start:2191 stop:2412 length:222 start_codon:yes stop_codon:yes gene_type:complete